MKIKTPMIGSGAGLLLAAAGMWIPAFSVAQNPFDSSVTSDPNVNQGAGGTTGAGYIALDRAKAIGTPPAQPRRRGGGMSLGAPAAAVANNQAVNQAVQTVQEIIKPKIKTIQGTRVFDNVTGELLDDARVIMVDETEKDKFFDDGTHGDRIPKDGEYAKVDERRDVLGQTSQRIKEQLIQALNRSEELDPIDFFGYSVMSADRSERPLRNRKWKIVPDTKGGPGFSLTETATEKPLEMPRYQDEEEKRDNTIAGPDGWAIRYMDEYRTNKGQLESEFLSLYVPQPPLPPTVAPPPGWLPFAQPERAVDPTKVAAAVQTVRAASRGSSGGGSRGGASAGRGGGGGASRGGGGGRR